jgi:hypothetical protein
LIVAKSKSKPKPFWVAGESYFIRTVTHHLTGRLVSIDEHEIQLEDAAWIASDGRFSDAMSTGALDEVEPFPDGDVVVGRGSLIDACRWNHDLPRKQK